MMSLFKRLRLSEEVVALAALFVIPFAAIALLILLSCIPLMMALERAETFDDREQEAA